MLSGINIFDGGCLRIGIAGRHCLGISSLSFTMAHDIASLGRSPLFVCRKDKFESNFPLFVEAGSNGVISIGDRSWDSVALSRIQLNYVNSASSLRRLMASLHAYSPVIDAIIIDSFDYLFEGLHDSVYASGNSISPIDELVMTLAFIVDAVDALNITRTQQQRVIDHPPLFLIINFHSLAKPVVDAVSRAVDRILVLKECDQARPGNAVSSSTLTTSGARGLYTLNGDAIDLQSR